MFFVKAGETNPESLLQFLDITFWKDMWQLHKAIEGGNNPEAKALISHLGRSLKILKAQKFVQVQYKWTGFKFKLTQAGYERKRELFPGM